jgi:hypothetical protein
MSISKLAIACSLTLGAMTLCLSPFAHAAEETKAKKPVKHKTAKAAKAAKATPAPVKAADPEEDEPDTTGSISMDFNCELGNQVTVFANATDDSHIALRWKKRVHRLTRVGTSTGAQRFENGRYGLVWIGIPAKSMLLDSKQGRQLANECKNTQQVQADISPKPAPQA